MDMIECKGKTVDEAVFTGLLKMDLSIDEVIIEILDAGGSFFKSAKVRLTKKTEEDIVETLTHQQEQVKAQESFEHSRPREYRERREGSPRRDSGGGSYTRDRRDNGPRRDYQREGKREEVAADPNFVPQEPGNEAEKFLLGVFEKMGLNVRLKSLSEDGMLKIDMSGRCMGMLIGRRGETLDALQYLTSLVLNNGKEDYTKVMLDTEDYRKKREDTLRRLAARLADKVQKTGKRMVLEPMNPYERRILHSTLQDYENVYTYSEGEDPFRSVVVALKGSEDEPQQAQNK
jgi:spoIIIJ-associated protein